MNRLSSLNQAFAAKFSERNKKQLLIWGSFLLFFAYFWRVYNLFSMMPAYGDALEVVWGILWYNHALAEGVNPFHYPLVFHPEGWQVGILAHTPLLFLIAQPFHLIGGEVFAYNMLAVIPFVISYVGALRFFRHYTKSTVTLVVVSLAFTFVTMRSNRVWGHLHILWATSFFPWLGDQLLQWRKQPLDQIWHKRVWMAGLLWGVMISFSLYSIFLGPVIFLFLEKLLLVWRKITIQLLLIAGIALLVGSTALAPYYFAVQNEPTHPTLINALFFWSSSLNDLFVPSTHHTIPAVKQLHGLMVNEPGGEGLNMGISTLFLMIVGIYHLFIQKEKRYGRLLVASVGLMLALGPFLKYDGQVIEIGWFTTLNATFWEIGYSLKPGTFLFEQIPKEFAHSIPLPSYFLTIFIPFWEGARTVSRFVMVGFVAVLGLVASGLDTLPKWWRWLLMLIFLVEMLPIQTGSRFLSLDPPHPAHAWLMAQPQNPGEAVADLRIDLMHGPEPLYLSWQTQWPTISAIGSFVPNQHSFLRDNLGRLATQPPKTVSQLLQSYQVRYLVVHHVNDHGKEVWDYLQAAPDYFTAVGCFESPETYVSPWPYTICIAEATPHATIANIYPVYGFSDEEPWGVWTIEDRPRFDFIATAQKPYELTVDAFPHCIEGQSQTLSILSNEKRLYHYQWEGCEGVQAQVIIPAEQISLGWNEVIFEMAYATSPVDLNTGNDPRTLAIGFSQLEIKPIDTPSQ